MSNALLVAMLAAILAVLAFERAIDASHTSVAFSAISGESIDPSQRARILGAALDATALAPASYAIHAVFGTLTFALAFAPSIGGRSHPFSPMSAVAIVVGLLALGGVLMLSRSRSNAPRVALDLDRKSTPAGVTLPVVVETFSNKQAGGGGYGAQIVVKKDGGGDDGASASGSFNNGQPKIYADRAATIGMVRMRLGKSPPARVDFVVDRAHPPEVEARLGTLALFLGSRAHIEGGVDDGTIGSTRSDFLEVRSIANDAIEIDGKRVSFPLPSTTSDERSGRIETVRYHLRAADTVEHAIAIMSAVEDRYRSRLWGSSVDRVFELGER